MEYLVPALIILGWAINVIVSRSGRRKDEMLRLIAEKNRCLTKIEELCDKAWGGYPPDEKSARDAPRERGLVIQIERLNKIYKELGELENCDEALSQVADLRRLATLDIEKLDMEEDEGEAEALIKQRIADVMVLLDKLRATPKKPI